MIPGDEDLKEMEDMDRASAFLAVTDLLDSFQDKGIPGSDCIVYHRGDCVYRHWRGYRDAGGAQQVTGSELYNIYSLSKPLTCAAALILVERGAFGLDDALCGYMPEFTNMYVRDGAKVRPAREQIRIRDLFCMTAGFTYDLEAESLIKGRQETEGACPTREMMRYLAREPLAFEPGTRWEYSLCHDVLAALVEVVSGMRFSEFVRVNIFEPLHMRNSTFDDRTADKDRMMAQYRYDAAAQRLTDCGKQIQRFKLGTEYESGGAGCISSVDDYIRFAEALRKGDVILKKETCRLMWSDQLSLGALRSFDPDHTGKYGYGLGVRCPQAGSVQTDFGWGGAGGAFLAVSPRLGYSLVYMQHVLDPPIQDARQELVTFMDDIFGI